MSDAMDEVMKRLFRIVPPVEGEGAITPEELADRAVGAYMTVRHHSECWNDQPGAVLCQVCGGDLRDPALGMLRAIGDEPGSAPVGHMQRVISHYDDEAGQWVFAENWHAIEGPNGQCACGPEKGKCGDRLAAFVNELRADVPPKIQGPNAELIADAAAIELIRSCTIEGEWRDPKGENLEPELTYALARGLVERNGIGLLRFTEFAHERGEVYADAKPEQEPVLICRELDGRCPTPEKCRDGECPYEQPVLRGRDAP